MVFFEDKNLDGCITTEADTSGLAVEVLQRLWYYPFGMAMEGLSTWETEPGQAYRYNGKERDTLSGWADFGARWGILEIGRWNGVDPLADKMPGWSPYSYGFDNPIFFIDPDGRIPSEPPVNGLEFFADDTGVYYWNNKNNNYDRFYFAEGSDQMHVGTYSANEFKEPVGDYTIIYDLSGEKGPDKFNPEHTLKTLAGATMATLASDNKPWRDISDQSKYPGVMIMSHEDMNGAVTLGNMIFTNPEMENVNTLDHEYGHYLDFKFHFNFDKGAYLRKIGVPSFISAATSVEHFESTTERRANRLGGAWGNNTYLKNVHR